MFRSPTLYGTLCPAPGTRLLSMWWTFADCVYVVSLVLYVIYVPCLMRLDLTHKTCKQILQTAIQKTRASGTHEEKEASKSGSDDGNTSGQSAYQSRRQVAVEDQERWDMYVSLLGYSDQDPSISWKTQPIHPRGFVANSVSAQV